MREPYEETGTGRKWAQIEALSNTTGRTLLVLKGVLELR